MRQKVLQYLKDGKALCGKVYSGFVETFNHLVSFSSNLKGDADLPGATGGISVDRSNPDFPILRFVPSSGDPATAPGQENATTITGDAEGSTAIEGAIQVDAAPCGLVVKTEIVQEGETKTAKLTIDAIGRDKNDHQWGAKTLTLPNGDYVHFLGCSDVDLSAKNPDDPDNPDNPEEPDEPDEPKELKRVITLTGDGERSTPTSGNVACVGNEGSGLVIYTNANQGETDENPNVGGTLSVDLIGRAEDEKFAIREFKFKDGKTEKSVKVFATEDVEIPIGKTIVSVNITPSAASGGKNTMVFTYSDGSTDTFEVMNGLDGKDGSGGDGEVPDINVDTQGDHTYIYIDGDLVATIPHGKTPAITANKNGKITTISCDGNPIATICDGNDGEDAPSGDPATTPGQEVTFITDISFALSGGKLVANLTKKRGKVVGLTDVGVSTVDVATSKEVTVVTGESYSQTTHQFTNTRTKVTVLAESSATGQTVFTSTPLSAE